MPKTCGCSTCSCSFSVSIFLAYLLGNSYKKRSDQAGLDDDPFRLAIWSADHGLIINKAKSVECQFYSKNTSSQLLFYFLNGEDLSREQTVMNLVVHFPFNVTWSTHIETVLTKCPKLSFFILRLRSMSIHKSLFSESFQPVPPLLFNITQ